MTTPLDPADPADPTEPVTDPADPAADPADPVDPPDLGDAGKKAIDRMKEQRNAEKVRRIELEREIAELKKPKPDPEAQPDLDAIRKQAREEAAAESMKDKALDKLEAKAARLFQNPEDARAFLASKVDDFIDGSKVDVEAITDALTDLLKERPYLAVAQGDKRFNGTADGGARNGNQPTQVTEQQLKTMTAEQIVQARKDGRLKQLMGA